MGRINVGRWILSGIVAAIVIDLIEGILNGVVLSSAWTDTMIANGKPPLAAGQVIAFNIYGLILGFVAAWIYAAIRPRFGAGPRAALYAALAVWVAGYVVADWGYAIMGAVPYWLVAVLILVGLPEIILATLAGAYFYREDTA